MKKISVLFAFLLVAAVTFVGCKKDEEEKAAPTIAFSGTDAGNGSVEIDFAVTDPKSLVFNVNITAEGEIATFTITKKIYASSTTTSQLTATGFEGKTSFPYNFEQSFASADFTGVTKIEYTFDVTDKQDPAKSVSKTFTVTKKAVSAGTAIYTWTNVTLGSISYNVTTGGYVNAASGVVYKHNATNASTSDFGYIWGNTYPKAIFAPDFAPVQSLNQGPSSWSARKTTKLVKLTSVTATQFDGIGASLDVDDVIESNVSSPTSQNINDCAANDIIGFLTQDGKKGLIKVVSLAGSSSSSTDAAITISIKVQQ